jgi:hypothetical protein
MGYGNYSTNNRFLRSASLGYESKSRDEIFTQNRERKSHKEMNPKGVLKRLCADSEEHPNTIPIQLYLDVTGSMGQIPHQMIKDGLPKLMGALLQNGINDASLMFGAIGDHECDNSPLQVGQFESGDAELDMWLERTYIEGGGGGNSGESYPLAWYFAGHHVQTDSFDKRGKKGFVFTVGDEPFLKNYSSNAIKEIMGDTAEAQGTYSAEDFFEEAQKRNHIYHIFIEHGYRVCNPEWKQLLGENLIIINDHNELSRVISDIILSKSDKQNVNISRKTESLKEKKENNKEDSENIFLL